MVAGAMIVYALMALVVLGVPDGNDYALASNLKQDRLANLPGQRIVLVGGSNLAYGADSNQLEALIGCPAVNMGMNGYFGIRYMLTEAAAGLRPGDLAVLAFEWDNFFKSVEGASTDLSALSKANPRAFAYLTGEQRVRVLTEGMSYVARQKALRLFREGIRHLGGLFGMGRSEKASDSLSEIESLAGFNPEGDLTSHLGKPWPGEIEQGTVSDRLDPGVVPLLARFIQDMEARGVSVMISYTPLMVSYYEQHKLELDQAYQAMRQSVPASVANVPSAYVYGSNMFFDTVYHLNAVGRSLRTRSLAQDIQAFDRWQCAEPLTVSG